MQHRYRAQLRRFVCVLIAAAFITGPAAAQGPVKGPVKVVASFSILGDFVKNVGGVHVDVADLVGPDGDPHVFEPSPADASLVTAANMVVVNGLGLEGWLDRLVAAANPHALVVVATRGITPRQRADDSARQDPHAWQSVTNAKVYVTNIRDGLIAIDPANRADYEANCAAYLAKLDLLDRTIRDAILTVPPDRRRVLTNHDAFGYFSDSYGIAFIGLLGVSTDAELSAGDLATTIRQLREHKGTGLFLENIVNPVQLKRISEETGVAIGGTLYSDALTTAGGEAPTYIDLMQHNIRTIVSALKR